MTHCGHVPTARVVWLRRTCNAAVGGLLQVLALAAGRMGLG